MEPVSVHIKKEVEIGVFVVFCVWVLYEDIARKQLTSVSQIESPQEANCWHFDLKLASLQN